MRIDYKYKTYLLAFNEEQRGEYDFLVEFGRINGEKIEKKDYFSEIDLTDQSFGTVKTLISCYEANDFKRFVETVFEIDDYANILEDLAYKGIMTIKYLVSRVEDIIHIETEMLSSSSNDYRAQMEQVDFSMFTAEYLQINELAEGDILKFDEIKKLKYSDCFVKLLLNFKNAEFERAVLKTNK